MLRQLLSRTVSKENTESHEMLHNNRFSKTGPYETHISTLHIEFPHLQSLLLYMQAIERARTDRRLGSHDSDSILAAEISSAGETTYHRIDCYDHADVESYRDMLSRKIDPHRLHTPRSYTTFGPDLNRNIRILPDDCASTTVPM